MSWYDDSVSVVSSDAFFMVTGTGLTGLATWEVRGGSSLLCHGPWFASLVVCGITPKYTIYLTQMRFAANPNAVRELIASIETFVPSVVDTYGSKAVHPRGRRLAGAAIDCRDDHPPSS